MVRKVKSPDAIYLRCNSAARALIGPCISPASPSDYPDWTNDLPAQVIAENARSVAVGVREILAVAERLKENRCRTGDRRADRLRSIPGSSARSGGARRARIDRVPVRVELNTIVRRCRSSGSLNLRSVALISRADDRSSPAA